MKHHPIIHIVALLPGIPMMAAMGYAWQEFIYSMPSDLEMLLAVGGYALLLLNAIVIPESCFRLLDKWLPSRQRHKTELDGAVLIIVLYSAAFQGALAALMILVYSTGPGWATPATLGLMAITGIGGMIKMRIYKTEEIEIH